MGSHQLEVPLVEEGREDESQGRERSCRGNSFPVGLRKAPVQAGSVVGVVAEALLVHHQRWEAPANYRLAIQALVTAPAAVAEDIALASDAPFLDKGPDISWPQSDQRS